MQLLTRSAMLGHIANLRILLSPQSGNGPTISGMNEADDRLGMTMIILHVHPQAGRTPFELIRRPRWRASSSHFTFSHW